MLVIGKTNTLTITKLNAVGAVLDGGKAGPVLLTATADTPELKAGASIDVFIYLDSEGELAATTLTPVAELDQIGWFKVVEVNELGGFLDWGLNKDLFIPYAQQQYDLEVGRHVLAKVYLDNQNRLTASTRLNQFVSDSNSHFKEGDKVQLIVSDKTELGYKAIIEHQCYGLLYENELIKPIKRGQKLTGFIKKIRSDHKIDLSLNPVGFNQNQHDEIAEAILQKLKTNDGYMLLNDRSPPETIYKVFGVSKKAFKKACGALYKKRLIAIEDKGIRLL